MKPADKLTALRHTCEHVLTQAMLKLYPDLLMAMGPATEDGFYFDFDYPGKISEADFPKIEAEMKKIINADLPVVKKRLSVAEAKKLFKNNPYKQEWLKNIKTPTVYWTGNKFVDLCAGPHVRSTGEIKAFKLLSVAGAYWRGSEKNKMLTRIYGTAFYSQKELDQYLHNLQAAKTRDHRILGKKLGLFVTTNKVGPGLVLWTPKGATIRREIEKFIYEEQTKRGYQHVYTPHIGKKSLWQTSGHWDLYRDKMYSAMKIDQDEYLVKPMNCPFHMMIYQSRPRSYRELPLRLAEIASVYRYEKAGELSGMLRVRYITQDDSHIFCTENQAIDEFVKVFDYTAFLLKTFGLNDYYLRLGLRSPKEKYLGSDALWDAAQKKISQAVEKIGAKFIASEGDAAFYGPKLDVVVKDALGREWQCGTIQLDFMLPQRFGLEYTDAAGKIRRPVLIHRAPLGSLERWLAILIEHYGGAFPLWLAPVQVKILPVSGKQNAAAGKIAEQLKNFRIELDDRSESLNAKIRDAEQQKIPYLLIIGNQEIRENKLAVRKRGQGNIGLMTVNAFTDKITREINQKIL
jgi:threonyl-tRNA synthetase